MALRRTPQQTLPPGRGASRRATLVSGLGLVALATSRSDVGAATWYGSPHAPAWTLHVLLEGRVLNLRGATSPLALALQPEPQRAQQARAAGAWAALELIAAVRRTVGQEWRLAQLLRLAVFVQSPPGSWPHQASARGALEVVQRAFHSVPRVDVVVFEKRPLRSLVELDAVLILPPARALGPSRFRTENR